MSLDTFLDEEDQNRCKKCGAKECGICKYCDKTIISGITCVSCAKSGKELTGWWYKDVNHVY